MKWLGALAPRSAALVPTRMRAQTRTIEPWVTAFVFVLVALCMTPMFGAGLLKAPFASLTRQESLVPRQRTGG
jgi:hypothetical protein